MLSIQTIFLCKKLVAIIIVMSINKNDQFKYIEQVNTLRIL